MTKITYFDFCAGIGAGHTALKDLGQSVGFSEIDPRAETTYRLINNANDLKNWGDLTKITPKTLPDFDLMIGGFPCQSFSIVGKRQGMQDSRGLIIFSLANILKKKKVKYFLLENVKGLVNHEKGETIKKIYDLLTSAGYKVSWAVLKSSDYGIPQIRERVYFVGIRKDLVGKDFKFSFPQKEKAGKLEVCLFNNDEEFIFNEQSLGWNTFISYLNNKYNKDKFNLGDLLKEDNLILDTRQSDLRLFKDNCPTLRTGRHGILYVRNGNLRRLSGKEGLLIQGFKKEQAKRAGSISNNLLLAQVGNAFTVGVINRTTKELLKQVNN